MFGIRFSRSSTTPIRERRRRRWSDVVATWLTIGGVVLDQAARQADIFPPSWSPYIRTAAFAFGLTAVLERVERHRDARRYLQRLNDDASARRM